VKENLGKEKIKMQDSYETIPAQESDAIPCSEEVNNSLQNGVEESRSEGSAAPENDEEEAISEQTENKSDEETDYSRIAAEDLAEIKRLFPEFSSLESLRDLDNAVRFAELRDAGLSVSEALAATNMDRMITSIAQRVARSDGKSHLRSAVPNASAVQKNRMSAEELHSARELFGSLSDRELERLYKRATS